MWVRRPGLAMGPNTLPIQPPLRGGGSLSHGGRPATPCGRAPQAGVTGLALERHVHVLACDGAGAGAEEGLQWRTSGNWSTVPGQCLWVGGILGTARVFHGKICWKSGGHGGNTWGRVGGECSAGYLASAYLRGHRHTIIPQLSPESCLEFTATPPPPPMSTRPPRDDGPLTPPGGEDFHQMTIPLIPPRELSPNDGSPHPPTGTFTK